ncbi:MAG: choice-of-anchor B family protein, partial [Calditrichota bacterium]
MKTVTIFFVALSFLITPILAQPPVSENVTFLSQLNPYPEVGYNDIWGYTAPDNREYALLGVLNGTSIIDITDATQPVEIAFIPSDFSIWKDLKTYQNYAYVVNETGGGLQIIDLSNLPNGVTELPPYTGFPDAHNIYIDVASATLLQSPANPNEPCQLISLADPENPVLISSFGGENHDAYAQNGRAFLAEGTLGSIGIFDISNPAAPSLLERIMIPAAGYSHNVWATEDDNFIMSTEETTGKTVKFWDISDLGNINLAGEYLAPDGIAHNTHIKEGFAYISHYGSGLRIVDLTTPGNLTEVGYYDSFPNGGPGFIGNWGAYPFFDSGKVLISDRTFGLITVYFEGALSGEALDPLPPTDFTAFSDFNTPTSVEITWTDPSELADGTPIQSGDVQIDLFRDDVFLTQVSGGIESFTDIGLQDGQGYLYSIVATVLSSDSSSFPIRSRAFSGGSPIPSAPENLDYIATLTDVTLTWSDPTTQEDGTAIDDLDSIRVYRDGVQIASVAAGIESYTDIAPANNAYTYRVTALDNETSRNESQASDSVTAFIG